MDTLLPLINRPMNKCKLIFTCLMGVLNKRRIAIPTRPISFAKRQITFATRPRYILLIFLKLKLTSLDSLLWAPPIRTITISWTRLMIPSLSEWQFWCLWLLNSVLPQRRVSDIYTGVEFNWPPAPLCQAMSTFWTTQISSQRLALKATSQSAPMRRTNHFTIQETTLALFCHNYKLWWTKAQFRSSFGQEKLISSEAIAYAWMNWTTDWNLQL